LISGRSLVSYKHFLSSILSRLIWTNCLAPSESRAFAA
jgi:hypothetical protein